MSEQLRTIARPSSGLALATSWVTRVRPVVNTTPTEYVSLAGNPQHRLMPVGAYMH